jgi:hypothetical protein
MAGISEIGDMVQCPSCIGTGQVACPQCSGWGSRGCNACSGSNTATCPHCNGLRSVAFVPMAAQHSFRGGVDFAARHSSRFAAAGALTALAAALLLGAHIHL